MDKSILVVDDNHAEQMLLSGLLQNEYNVLRADNGEEALAVLSESFKSVYAIILDIIMPVMDGYTVLERLKASPEWRHIPVLVVTGLEDVYTQQRVLELGANYCVTKPFNVSLLKLMLRNAIGICEAFALSAMILKDPLTGLYTRDAFFNEADRLINGAKPAKYMLSSFDINHFRVINDQYGTKTGDDVLRYIAECLVKLVTAVDGIACRIMADRFAVLCPADCIDSEAVRLLHREINSPHIIGQSITVRIGRYLVEELSIPVSSMYDRAVMAQDSIKGRYDKYIMQYQESMREKLLREQEIVTNMRDALRNGEFEAWFQPQYNHATGALIGSEALVRWRKNGELISPGIFIPVFERNGFVYEVDKFIWRRVCMLLRKWLDEGRAPLPVSVNISRYDIYQPDFLDTLCGFVAQYRLPASLLRLEVTESVFADDGKQVVHMVQELIRRGFTAEIDDFGSCYSSLNTLKDVPAQILKLDMKFLESTENSQRSGNIVESVIRMAKWLGMSVIAEGVETREQADYLKSLGCNFIQGYFYAKPMPCEQFEVVMQTGSKQKELSGLDIVENFDNAAFWTAESLDTLVFNHFSGGSFIFEYYGGHCEMLRVNGEFAYTLRSDMSDKEILKLEPFSKFDGDTNEQAIRAIERAYESGRGESFEAYSTQYSTTGKGEYVRISIRRLAEVGGRFLFYGYVDNITAERESVNQLHFLNDLAGRLLYQPDAEKGIYELLENILTYFKAKRTYVFEFSEDYKYTSNTYELCADGVEAVKDSLQSIPMEDYPIWLHAFDEKKYIYIDDVDALGNDRSLEREILRSQGVSSLIAVPLYRDGKYLGFIGADDSNMQTGQAERFAALGDYMSELLTRRDLLRRVKEESRTLRAVMEGVPGGFCRFKLGEDGKLSESYYSQGYLSLVNMSHEQIAEYSGGEVLGIIHPDDLAAVKNAISEVAAGKELHDFRYRLRSNGGRDYLTVSVHVKAEPDEHGNIYVNVYYSDAAELISAEARQTELLDNLPCGAALYEYDGKTLAVKHLNKHYWVLVDRAAKKYSDISFIDAVYPADREIIKRELSAIEQGRIIDIRLRILCGKDEYRGFHICGNVIKTHNGVYRIYAAYTPVCG